MRPKDRIWTGDLTQPLRKFRQRFMDLGVRTRVTKCEDRHRLEFLDEGDMADICAVAMDKLLSHHAAAQARGETYIIYKVYDFE